MPPLLVAPTQSDHRTTIRVEPTATALQVRDQLYQKLINVVPECKNAATDDFVLKARGVCCFVFVASLSLASRRQVLSSRSYMYDAKRALIDYVYVRERIAANEQLQVGPRAVRLAID